MPFTHAGNAAPPAWLVEQKTAEFKAAHADKDAFIHLIPDPLPEWPVRKFAIWWMRNKPFAVPADGVRVYEGVYGLTLYRHGQFQAQLFIVAPNCGSPTHAHPNIDSVEYGLAGADTFTSERNFRLHGLICVAPGERHTAAAREEGGAFISFQKWLNGVSPTSVELDWIGDPIDAGHAEDLSNPKQ